VNGFETFSHQRFPFFTFFLKHFQFENSMQLNLIIKIQIKLDSYTIKEDKA